MNMSKILIWPMMIILSLSACTNMANKVSSGLSTMMPPSMITNTTSYSHTPINVSTTTANNILNLSVLFAPNSAPLTGFCLATGGAATASTKPCSCQLEWVELNTVAGNSVSINRLKKYSATNVQSSMVTCAMSQAFWDEIPMGTTVKISVVPGYGNTSGLSSNSINYKKGTSVAASGDFTDDTLTPFRNIFRYTCYSKRVASHEVLNQFQVLPVNVPAGAPEQNAEVLVASRFCTGNATSENCINTRGGYSAQSYYRNLYIRSDKVGQINSTNGGYDCPQVFESIMDHAGNDGSSNPLTPQERQFKFWPLDTTFAVSTVNSSEWSVQISSASVLNKSSDPNSVDDQISGTVQNPERLMELAAPNGISWKILGYGKVPNSDGTCGTIVDSTGKIRPLTRLRRYRVVYPPIFENSGQPVATRLEADQIYVADRLVADTNGNLTGNMIYGPKPCNFSWFDHEGVTNQNGNTAFQTHFDSTPTYRSTGNYYFLNSASEQISVNPDGRILPNRDRGGMMGGIASSPSCSSAIAIYDETSDGSLAKARLMTSWVNRKDYYNLRGRKFYLNQIHLSPIDAWTPEYVEDTNFKACVPLADPYVEPPLHFYRDTNQKVAWCAKVYPTQNPFWSYLNSKKRPTGTSIAATVVNWGTTPPATNTPQVEWFTSHVVNAPLNLDYLTVDGTFAGTRVNACGGTNEERICKFSLGSSADYANCVIFLNNYLTANSKTKRCDRTVKFDVYQDYKGIPLLAKDSDIKDMLKTDLSNRKSFSCSYSVHSNPNKVRNKDQPYSNCCGVKFGNPILNTPGASLGNDEDGHLEPYQDPMYPDYRYCGTPVD